MPSELTTVEKYMLAQILACGRIHVHEYKVATDIPQHGTGVRDQTLTRLREKGALQQTLFEE